MRDPKVAFREFLQKTYESNPELVWKTGQGELILIEDLSDQHLLNILGFLNRKVNEVLERKLQDAVSFLNFLNGEHAIDAAEYEITKLREDPDYGYFILQETVPQFDNLLAEVHKRGLEFEWRELEM